MAETFFLIQHWKKQQKIFLANLVLLKHKPDTDPVHDWRVAVKKFRSYLKLFFFIQERKSDKEWMATTEKLFRILGKQRDISMSQSLLAEIEKKNKVIYPSLRSYFDYIFSESEKRTNHALPSYDAGELQKTCKQIIVDCSAISNEEIQKRTTDVIARQIEKIMSLFKDVCRKNAHLLRKLMKDLLYWVSICPFPTPIDAGSYRKLNKITDELGAWQDMEVFLLNIQHFRNDQLPKGTVEYAAYKELEKQLKTERRELLQKAEKAAKDFFSTVDSKKILNN